MTVPWRSPLDLAAGSAESLEPERRPFRLSRKVLVVGASVILAVAVYTMSRSASPGTMSGESLTSTSTPSPNSIWTTEPHSGAAIVVPSSPTPLEGDPYEGAGRAVGVSVESGTAPQTAAADHNGSFRAYALPLVRLSGLPSGAAPGTRLDLWALWQPPATREPSAQLLIHDIVLERIIPPVTPDGPETAILLVPRNRISDLIYADRFSQMSAALIR
jgi:hypothetical protein